MAVDLVISVVSKVAEFFVGPIGRQIGYVFSYSSNIENLKDEVKNLAFAKERMEIEVDDARKNGNEIFKDVSEWLTSVDDVTKEAKTIIDHTANTRCFMGWCPNLMRCHLSRKAKKVTLAADKLKQTEFDKVSHSKPPQGIGPVKGFEAFKSREDVMENVVKALKDADVNLIGVYGMSGVGKTTLVKEVASRAQKEGIFKSMVIATVTHNQDIEKIQQSIAEWLDFKLDVESNDVRAARLRDRLKREEKLLVILDDVWERIKLEEVGIPYGNDHKECKILMTSRDQNVFLEMDMQRYFQLQVLDDKEAKDLFQRTVGNFKDSTLQPIGAELAKRCAGLPVLIVTVASALKNKGLSEWKDALEELKTFDNKGFNERVYKALELSYNFLGDEEKSLLHLCVQVSPFISSNLLLVLSLGLGLFKQRTTVQATRDRLFKVLNDLKRSCFLLEGRSESKAQIHDAVHGFATSVARKDHCVFTVPYGTELDEWPEDDTFEHCTAISFMHCKKIPQLPEVLECPNLISFIFGNSDSSLKIPDGFFNRMKKLKVLDVSDLHLAPMPSSLQLLENLQTLCMFRCDLEDIAPIGQLKKLQVLVFSSSTIVQLPKQVGNLTRLKLLNLRDCQRLQVIPAGVLSCLTRLEELYMGNSFVQWDQEEGRNANLAELKVLSNLIALEMQIIDAKVLPKDLFSDKLERFEIIIGEEWDWDLSYEYENLKRLKLQLSTSIRLERVKALLMRAEDLYLNEIEGVKSVLYDLEHQDFPELKHLHVQNSLNIQHIIDNTRMGRSHHSAAFPKLESLTLDYLNSLEKICHGPIKVESFSNLRKLNVRNCDRLKNLLSYSMARGLTQLQEIYVSGCKMIEAIVAKETGDHNSSNHEELNLTGLWSLTLEYLPQFTSFMSQLRVPSVATSSVSSAEIVYLDESETPVPLFNRKIMFPNLTDLRLVSIGVEKIWSNQLIELSQYIKKLTTLVVDGCGNLNYLFTSSMIKSLAQLKKLEISNCKSMEEVIAAQELGGETVGSNILFPKVEFLKIKCLSKLTRFCTGNFIEFPSLKLLHLESCHQLKRFISDSLSSNVALLNHALFAQEVAFPVLEELHIRYMHNLTMIWHDEFHVDSLKVLKVKHSNELLKIFSTKMLQGGFQNLEELVVKNCDSVEEVFDDLQIAIAPAQSRTSELRTLELYNLPNLKHVWKWNIENPKATVSFAKLGSIFIWNCQSLKTLFPASIARNLQGLEVLNIDGCNGLEEVVLKEETAEMPPKFVFPQMKSLNFWRLEQLKSFYCGIHTLECPVLQKLVVVNCKRLKIFNSEAEEDMQSSTNMESQLTLHHHQPLFSFTEVMPSLVELTLNNKHTAIIQQGQFPAELFLKLKFLHLLSFHDTSSNFPFHLLRVFQSVDHLCLGDCCWKEILPKGITIGGEDAIALARIRFLEVWYLPQLKHLWNQDSQHGELLPNLESLKIFSCHGLKNLALSFGSFQNLTTLYVSNCNGLINLVTTSTANGLVTLTHLTVENCKMVTEIVANECQSGSEIIFEKLTSLKLLDLKSLTSFSPSTSFTIKIPSLEEVVLSHCPKMKVFSHGVVSSPKLYKVHITKKMDEWRWVIKDLNTTVQQLHSQMVGFCGIQQLRLSEFPQMKNVWHDQSLPVSIFIWLRELVVDDYEIYSVAVPSNLLPFLNGLRKLELRNCDSVEVIFGPAMPNVDGRTFEHLSQLKKLQLIDLPRLREVWSEVPKVFLNFKNLQVLKIHNCKSLRNVFTPGMCLGLVQLKEVEVKSCDVLEFIVAEDGAVEGTSVNEIKFPLLNSIILESLPSLNNFNSGSGVVHCPTLKAITIVDCPTTFASTFFRLLQSLQTDKNAEPKITFPSLTDIKLSSIGVKKIWSSQLLLELSPCIQKMLTTLVIDGCEDLSYLFTLSMIENLAQLKNLEICNCKSMKEVIAAEETTAKILFSVLEFLKIKGCPQMKSFISNLASADEFGQTNTILFDQKIACPNLEKLQIFKMTNIKMIWSNQLHPDSFCKLKELTVEDGKSLLKIFPASMLERIQNLENLDVKNCDSVEEVFDIQDLVAANLNESDNVATISSQLRTLDIDNLPNLKHIWNKDPSGSLWFHNLREMYVHNCSNLKCVFPASIAEEGFPKLETLWINHCGMENVVSKKESIEATLKFVFPNLKSLELWELRNLKSFYSGIHILESPRLEYLRVFNCVNLETFAMEPQNPQQIQMVDERQLDSQVHSLFSFEKVIRNLKVLTLRSKEIPMIQLQGPFHAVKELELQYFDDKNSSSSPFDILPMFPNVETFVLNSCDFEELFSDELVNEEKNAKSLAQIQGLRLRRFPYLTLICSQRPKLEQVLKNIEELDVMLCDSLINLVPSSVSFSNLTKLKVWKCDKLMKLVTSQTAKSMVHLTEMIVKDCKMLKEIIANEVDEEQTEITLTRLQSLTLVCLTRLDIFSSATCTLKCPSLEEVIVIQCHEMKVFSQGVVSAPELQKVYLTEARDKWHWTKDLNTTLQQLYTKMALLHQTTL